MRIWRDDDMDMSVLDGKAVAVIGYGIQGRAQAQNLRDSGVRVVVGGRPEGRGIAAAREEGFEARVTGQAVEGADVVFVLVPDEAHVEVLESDICPNLKSGATLGFACGYSLTFSRPKLPGDVDVVMVSPKGTGNALRERFVAGGGLPALVAVHRDATGRALETALAYAKAIGSGRVAAIESSFREEAHTDLFGEQAVLCGGIPRLMEAGFQTLVEAGYSPEAAYIECVWEAKAVVDLIFERGIAGMYEGVSPTARYGGLTRGERIADDRVRTRMREILAEVSSGKFAEEFEAAEGRVVRDMAAAQGGFQARLV